MLTREFMKKHIDIAVAGAFAIVLATGLFISACGLLKPAARAALDFVLTECLAEKATGRTLEEAKKLCPFGDADVALVEKQLAAQNRGLAAANARAGAHLDAGTDAK